MERQEFTTEAAGQGLWAIETPMVRSYLALGDERGMLIDTGLGDLSWNEIIRSITELPVFALNTHGHEDHCRGDGQFDVVRAHPLDIAAITSYSGLEDINVVPLADHESIDLGGWRFEVIHAPGHTPGSVCLLDITHRRLFTGDSVLSETVVMNTEPGSLLTRQYRDSMRMLYGRRDEFDGIYPNHQAYPLGCEWLLDLANVADEVLNGTAGEVPFSMTACEDAPPLEGRLFGAGRARLLFIVGFPKLVR